MKCNNDQIIYIQPGDKAYTCALCHTPAYKTLFLF